MGSVFPYKGGYRIKYKDGTGAWITVTTKQRTKRAAEQEMHEKEIEVERQRLGLAPVALNPEKWTVADLMHWWLDTYSRHQEAHESNEGTIRNHILGSKLGSKLLEHLKPGDVEELLQSKQCALAPGTINHIRQFLVRAFNKARKAGKWLGPNPTEDVDTRHVPETIVDILSPEEVFPFFEALALEQRPVFAAAIGTGLRKGELCGEKKEDVDLARRLLFVRCSYAQPFPKSRKERPVRIPEEFVPFFQYALQATPGPWLFPDETGAMRTRTWQPEDILRRALKRAGIVTGYTHVCRRKGCGFQEDRADAAIRPCPKCGFKLWPKGNIRHIRFHDLRHTYASVLLMFGANLTSVQKLLGHSDPKITERRYGHLLPNFMKSEVDRLRFGLDRLAPKLAAPAAERATAPGSASHAFASAGAPLGIPVVSAAAPEKTEAGTPSVSREVPASLMAGCTGLERVEGSELKQATARWFSRMSP